jgi:protein-S-isoprenylcysteine O-methyltransferase Ste14
MLASEDESLWHGGRGWVVHCSLFQRMHLARRYTSGEQGLPLSKSRGVFGAVISLYFIIALEVLIMISPFAAFFYAAFNPVLLFLAQWPATRWLAAFFLPHMVLPPGLFLQTVRVAGSVLFVGGMGIFLVCAGQVYFNKLSRRGPALGGLYAWIRHPQYVALALTGLGLAILWPRFLTIVLWTVMVGLYDLLARDEERRMVSQFSDKYQEYMARTGRFLPRGLEQAMGRLPFPKPPALRSLLGLVFLVVVAVGGAFALRGYTIARLPLWSEGRVTAMAILPGDSIMVEHRMADVLELPEVKSRLDQVSGPILVYLVPPQYVMQGMIADIGPQWRLYEHHQTLAMIADWIFHPFRHLQGGHMMMHHDVEGASAMSAVPGGMVRRLIFLRVDPPRAGDTPALLFAINSTRVPQFFADVDIHNLVLLDIHPLGPGTGWGRVPTPMF